MFCKVLAGIKERNKKAILVVKGIALVENASQRLDREGIEHGIIQGNSWRNRPNESIQVCSISTLARRKKIPPADILIIDEAQDATSKGYKWLIDQYPEAYTLAVSATPHVKQGLKHLADEVVYPITINQMMDQGYLCRPKYFVPSKIDVSGLRVDSKTGDYKTSDMDELMDDVAIYGDLVDSYKKYATGRKAFCFAVSIKHSKKIREHFEANGIRSAHVDAKTPIPEREETIRKLEEGELDVVVNVGIFCVGVDVPSLDCIIMARPTKSYNLMIQQIGRGTRIFPGKKDFIVLDHSANILEHGLIENEMECILEGWKSSSKDKSITSCEHCFSAFSSDENYKNILEDNFFGEEKELARYYDSKNEHKRGQRAYRTKLLYFCPECEHDNTPEADPIIKKEGEEEDELHELTEEQVLDLKVKGRLKELKKLQKAKGFKRGWVYFTLKAEFGDELAEKFVKKRVVPDWVKRKMK